MLQLSVDGGGEPDDPAADELGHGVIVKLGERPSTLYNVDASCQGSSRFLAWMERPGSLVSNCSVQSPLA
jgi:hypothetical protein